MPKKIKDEKDGFRGKVLHFLKKFEKFIPFVFRSFFKKFSTISPFILTFYFIVYRVAELLHHEALKNASQTAAIIVGIVSLIVLVVLQGVRFWLE